MPVVASLVSTGRRSQFRNCLQRNGYNRRDVAVDQFPYFGFILVPKVVGECFYEFLFVGKATYDVEVTLPSMSMFNGIVPARMGSKRLSFDKR